MTFTNDPVAMSDLPQLEEVTFHPLQSSYRVVQLIRVTIAASILLLMLIVGTLMIPDFLFIKTLAGLALLVFVSANYFLVFKRFALQGYALRDHDILYRSGWWIRSITVIPFNRVQHTEIGQGPVERYFNLAELTLFTAGGQLADLSIPGLTPADAQRIRDFVVNKAGQDAA